MKNAVAALAVAIIGLVTAFVSGLALVPRVRLVEVLTLIATAIGSGAALAVAVVQLRQARTAARAGRATCPDGNEAGTSSALAGGSSCHHPRFPEEIPRS